MRELSAAKPQTEGETDTGKVNGGYDTFLSDQKSVAKESLKEGFRFPSLRIHPKRPEDLRSIWTLRARDEGRKDGSCVTPVILTGAHPLNPVFRKTASCETKYAYACH
jgi:hypothetical protein